MDICEYLSICGYLRISVNIYEYLWISVGKQGYAELFVIVSISLSHVGMQPVAFFVAGLSTISVHS